MENKVKELLALYDLPTDELISISGKVTADNFGNTVELCSIISAKTGACSQNCKYCAQSSHYNTTVPTHSMISIDEVIKTAIEARDNGARLFSPVTSGRKPIGEDFDALLRMTEAIAEIDGLTCCGSYGIINETDAKLLRDAGMKRYNHNLNSSKSYYTDICTTHKYEDRLNTVKLIKSLGIEACTGGIIGMGETRRQRVELALELAELNPVSVPVNFLHPIAGTPFESYHDKINEEEILKTLAVFRIALPKARIRYAGGRLSRFSGDYQDLGIKAGVNGIMIGNYLTTIGISPEEDRKLIENNRLVALK